MAQPLADMSHQRIRFAIPEAADGVYIVLSRHKSATVDHWGPYSAL
ncbi:hypothetical protein FOXG_22778 [Fusarium oxysporum f. sp. lycopersici 4287]|uniref:Uncharacterized protein n=1 Tax=Fusarium oxysporum f. sp. lycopersici (strain 4287 / CBS 123668 / FGSC 9935 / NRRL 34936) TaxID=426428 RepID=A0A0J9WCD9_FUSO4|nr:hypothetical protein FOXG_22778 [Fusarium oxysporum f. sp. lycopersici 4287]KNB20226.1 hypothetical protein FOXG_22778 [Fusarium oxysporum f. sp. lycopersici 4287]